MALASVVNRAGRSGRGRGKPFSEALAAASDRGLTYGHICSGYERLTSASALIQLRTHVTMTTRGNSPPLRDTLSIDAIRGWARAGFRADVLELAVAVRPERMWEAHEAATDVVAVADSTVPVAYFAGMFAAGHRDAQHIIRCYASGVPLEYARLDVGADSP